MVGLDKLFGVVAEFYAENAGTRLRFLNEVLGGTWDALASGRADLAIGATGDGPPGTGFTTRPLGRLELALVAAPFHPAVREAGTLSAAAVQAYRAVSIADSSRLLPPRTVGLLSGQDVLTVPTLEAKVAALVAGLGIGSIPRWIAEREAYSGRLRILEASSGVRGGELLYAWDPEHAGKALKWFVKRLEDPLVSATLLS
jgi:DNA-binding transcriptional LysR family regulator